jgi:flagellar protein FlgJ
MIDQTTASGSLALDTKGLSELQRLARQGSPEALGAAARQFEALFINMMLKSLRDATSNSDLLDSEQSRMYTSLLDQQLSQSMASKGLGLADILIHQLKTFAASDSGQTAGSPDVSQQPRSVRMNEAAAPMSRTAQEFRSRLAADAQQASRVTGIPAEYMIGHAALETGWGKREILGSDGTNSYNLFGIKSTSSWKGRVVEASTTEYSDGVPRTVLAKFRAYDSYADAFADYANLLRSNPRYKQVIEGAQDAKRFAEGLQRSGYATDPNYADKLIQVIRQFTAS